MGDELLLRSKQLLDAIERNKAKDVGSSDVPSCLEDKLYTLMETRNNLETDLITFHQQQMILKGLELPPEQMLTEGKIEAEVAESEGILSEVTEVHKQNLLKIEATKKSFLEALDRLNVAVIELSQKISMLEDKYASINFDGQETNSPLKGKLNPAANKIAKERILLILKNAEEEKQIIQERISRLQSLRHLVDKAAVCVESETESQLKLNTLQEKLARLELMSGIKCTIADDYTMTVHFVDHDSQRLPDYSKLVITLSFALDENHCLELSRVDVNQKVSEVEIAVQSAKSDKDLPKLIRRLKKSWLSHVPLIAEISSLRENHAIDWIPEDRTLHVILGHCIVCRLSIPPSYPHGDGSVSLEQIMGGHSGLSEENVSPPDDLSLTGWVNHLEKIFGMQQLSS